MNDGDRMSGDLELLDEMLEAMADEATGSMAGIASRGAKEAPLSLQQERLWFLNELTGGTAAYNISSAFRLRGPLDARALGLAFEAVVARHGALRTAIRNLGGTPRQILCESYDPVCERHDWSSHTQGPARDEALLALARSEAARTFELGAGRPLRVVLVRVGAQEHVAILVLHHIMGDAWSLAIMMAEVAAFYTAEITGERARLPTLPITYLDYALWQRDRADDELARRELAYWRAALRELPLLELPLDRPRPPMQTFNGATLTFTIPERITAALSALAARERTTLFCVLMAALQALLGRHARQHDVAIGTSVAGRDRQETEGLIGFFTNMVVIRGRLAADPTFAELVRAQTAVIREALDHATLSYDRLVESLKVARDPSRNPLFQVAFTLLNTPTALPRVGSLAVETLLNQEAARFDLELFLREAPGGLSGVFTYNTDLFVAESVRRLIAQLTTLLEDAAAHPDTPVSRLALAGPAHVQRLPAQPPQLELKRPALVHEAFLEHARLRPGAVALMLDDRTLTYEALERRARGVAHRLIAGGVCGGDPVGLWFEPGFDMIAAMLGTLMAGAAYVPLDPAYPTERIAYILADSGITTLVCGVADTAGMPPFQGTLIPIDTCTASGDALLPAIDPAGLAYIIYTSGSTGRPKGVEVTHTNVARLFSSCDALFKFDRRDVWTFFHSYAFDFSVWEIWGALVHGASVVIVPPQIARAADAFYRLICDAGVTILSQTPAAFRHLIAAEEAHSREQAVVLRYVVFGGEALDPASLASWVDRHGDDAPLLINMYGITETTVHVTFRRIGLADTRRPCGSIIGAPLPDLSIRLLDPHGVPVPPGMTGEIYVGGAGVARGYRNQPVLTAERFVAEASGTRLYKSGDLARINAHDELEYRGRADAQVKLRGYRIETGEIESALKAHPGIADAAVVLRGHEDEARLVAYVIKRPWVEEEGGAARDWIPSFDMIYAETTTLDDELDIVGWTDSYDHAPLPAEHMRLWRDETLERLRALRPSRVLELGTGSGMLLLPLAQEVERYDGLDFSAEAIARLGRKMARRGYRNVTLHHREVIDHSGLARDFDLVILNSTAQYFPHRIYFETVISQALDRLVPGGALFVGDLRHLGLLRHFHASLLMHRRPQAASRGALRGVLATLIAAEKELLVDPAFFQHLAQSRSDIARINIFPKENGGANELTTYRYDAIIVIGARAAVPSFTAMHGPESLEVIEASWSGAPLWVCDLPNARLAATNAFLDWLDADDDLAELPAWEEWTVTSSGFDPALTAQSLRSVAGAAALCWPSSGGPGHFAVALGHDLATLPPVDCEPPTRDPAACFNTPAKSLPAAELASKLRQHLTARLPSYMIPSAYVALSSFPLTLNGKLDVRALPAPEDAIAPERVDTTERTPIQHAISRIWAEVLNVGDVGLHANFFEVGGHSLLATQVMSRIRTAFSVDLPLRSLFDRPTVAEFAQLLQVATARGVPQQEQPCIEQADRSALLPLSFSQQRFWFLEQVETGPIAHYNISLALRLDGALDRDALRTAIAAIVARHETLRTRFVLHDGVPMQRIEPPFTPSLEAVDLTHLPPRDAETALEAHRASHAHARFDMQAAPPVRFALIRISPRAHLFQVTLHHAVCDGWSLGVMTREFSRHYEAACAGRTAQLPELPVQFADVAVWQRRQVAGERLDALLARWRQRLEGAPTALDLPLMPAPRAAAARLGRVVRFSFDGSETRGLKMLAQATGSTLFMVLAAGFAALLDRYTGAHDVVIGTPIANRRREDLEGLIGCFLNTLALRIQPQANATGLELLSHVRERVLEAYELQDAPFEAVVTRLRPERSRDSHALFQVMLVLQNMPLGRLSLPGLEVSTLAGEETASHFDLTLSFIEVEAGAGEEAHLEANLEYNADKFQRSAVQRFGAQLQALLRGLRADPQRALADLDIRLPGERDWLIGALTRTDREVASGCLHELAEQQALRTPGQIAVRDTTSQLTFLELDRRANFLARALYERGIGPDDVVGICAERSVAMVVGILGILKAGAAYLPLDPAYPADRLTFMMKDACARALLTQRSLAGRVSYEGPVEFLDDVQGAGAECARAPTNSVRPDNLAYVMYTSGSTGSPKGVMVSHAALVNYVSFSASSYLDGVEGAIVMSVSFAFDLSLNPLFIPLLTGRTLLMLPPTEALIHLKRTLERCDNLAMYCATPAHMEVLQQTMAHSQLARQAQVILVGGEALLDLTIAPWRIHAPATRLYNEYGPTEATGACSAYLITPDSPRGGPIPIGKPIWNLRLYVLDQRMEPVPAGVPGDVYVAGVGVARGYLGQPALTALRFQPDPFGDGGRIYRTGDRARWREEGVLEYLGRDDDQVKLRGFRIELGEIEAALRRHPDIQDAAALVCDGPGGAQRLIGYIVSVPGREAPLRELSLFLQGSLPDFMVPALFVPLRSLPQTVNGKVDRKALALFCAPPERTSAQGEIDEPHRDMTPRQHTRALSAIEARLAALWSEVLKCPIDHPEADFFALGGDSLTAVKLVFRIEQEFARTLPLASLFTDRTVQAQAAALDPQTTPARPQGPLVLFRAQGTGPTVLLVHDISGQILSYRPLAESLAGGSIYGLCANLPGERSAAEAEVSGMAAVYARAVLEQGLPEPFVLVGHSFGAQVAAELTRELQAQGRNVVLLAVLDAFPDEDPEWSASMPQDDIGLLDYMVRTLEVSLERRIDIGIGDLQVLAEPERAQLLTRRLIDADVVPEGTRPETVLGMFAVYKSNLNSLRSYRPGRVDCPVVVWRTAELASLENRTADLGWGAYTDRGVQIRDAGGEHVSMLKSPYVQDLAHSLNAAIQQAMSVP